jgi:hypothetical protein
MLQLYSICEDGCLMCCGAEWTVIFNNVSEVRTAVVIRQLLMMEQYRPLKYYILYLFTWRYNSTTSIIRAKQMIQEVRFSETLIKLLQPTRRYNQADSHIHSHRSENLTSYMLKITEAAALT